MDRLPFDVHMELEGWRLFWARLEVVEERLSERAELRARVAERVRERFTDTAQIGTDPTVAALRSLFRAAGCDPTRYRPASEALLRRLVKGSPIPEIHPLVDLNNCLSAELAVPCCVMADGSVGHRMTRRMGGAGESYESLRGPFNLSDKPVLFDDQGPLDTPITGNVRVMVHPDTTAAWLVAYMPGAELTAEQARTVLADLSRGLGISVEQDASRSS
jgi:DNA/RNA-binding domain of Phe-tRNA-synthetase-like protein